MLGGKAKTPLVSWLHDRGHNTDVKAWGIISDPQVHKVTFCIIAVSLNNMTMGKINHQDRSCMSSQELIIASPI